MVPTDIPRIEGREVPASGREGGVVPVGQVQSVSEVQLGFRQKPDEQVRPEEQLESDPHVPLHVFGVPVGVGVDVETEVGVGVDVETEVGVGLSVDETVREKLKVQAVETEAGDAVASWAFGRLVGALGATDSCLKL
jgi:hypothetical protein